MKTSFLIRNAFRYSCRIAIAALFFTMFLVFHLTGYGQIPTPVFHQLSIKDGLSEGTVRAIVEDKRGFMWFGTEDGLNKYDGYKFTIYKTDLKDKFSISSNNIKCFYNDSKGNLWIGTRHGVSIYDHELDKFYNFNSDVYPALKFIEGDIEAIHEDKQGYFWILTSTHGIYKVTNLYKEPERFLSSTNHNGYVSWAIDENSDFYIGTYEGLLKFNTRNNQFEDLSPRLPSLSATCFTILVGF
jgi:two-component system sensor histidine kinase ChiS